MFAPGERQTLMDKLWIILCTALVTWWLAYHYLYSPKAQIKKLWDEVFKLTYDFRQIREASTEAGWAASEGFNHQINKRKALIKAILEHSFDPEKDADYIHEHKTE